MPMVVSARSGFREMRGIYLVPPHGRWIMTGFKTHIVKKRHFWRMTGIPLVLVEGKEALGIVVLGEPIKITRSEFRRLRHLHRVTDEEAYRWWGDFEELYLFPVRVIWRFREPFYVELVPGIQTFIRRVRVPYDYLPRWMLRASNDDTERFRSVIKEIMDYGEWERYFERLRELERSELERKGCGCGDVFSVKRLERLMMDSEGEGLICVDVDGTIFGKAPFPYVGRLIRGAREVLRELARRGYKIIIWSGRNSLLVNSPRTRRIALGLVKVVLDLYGIPYHAIDYGEVGKIPCEFYIDDRAIGFRGDWYAVLEEIERRRRVC